MTYTHKYTTLSSYVLFPVHIFNTVGETIMKKLVFLGGTCGKNPWRRSFRQDLINRGIAADLIVCPVAGDWRQTEEPDIDESEYILHYLAKPYTGTAAIPYHLAKAVMGLYDEPSRTIVVFNTTGMSAEIQKEVAEITHDLKVRFPLGNIFESTADAIHFLTACVAS